MIKIKDNQGAILIEACLVFFIGFITLIIQVELIRRGWTTATLQLLAFEHVRERVLGVEQTARQLKSAKVYGLLEGWTMVDSNGSNLQRYDYEVPSKSEAVTKLHVRYPAFFRIGEPNRIRKTNFEVTEQCRFPFSFR